MNFSISFPRNQTPENAHGGTSQNSNPYFDSTRKGKVSDMEMQLRKLAGSRAPGIDDAKRELFKKEISNMTIGIDVLSVFSEMVMCSATTDLVLKKMCYLYVGDYVKYNPDLAPLTINFLQRDCKDEDPMIRGLALRSLCLLRVANLVEYLVGPLGNGLKDGNSYVRMVATVGVLKLYHISSSTCMDADFPGMLKHLMLNDKDALVIANCLTSLQEIWGLEASTSEKVERERENLNSKSVVFYFLNRIGRYLPGLGLPIAPSPTPSPPAFKLNAKAVLDPNSFQQKWCQLPVAASQVNIHSLTYQESIAEELDENISLYDFPINTDENDHIVKDLSKNHVMQSSPSNFFKIFSDLSSEMSHAEEIIFCGKLLPYKLQHVTVPDDI
ncbi:beta-adaptin-like protein A [Olea europaea var. sylvestris]|uniref:beta-adaptin-like protein A n=1 Tax=Olea europaea var. sylvestris TaxID=158386 RepID=UPI000C1D31B9|nr:beta-adaptin-like protein A [Olea europaea var. sylvestris]